MSVAIDGLLAEDRFARHIDPKAIGVLGFSQGGYTALALGGARIDLRRWELFCADAPQDPACRLPPEATFTLEKIELLKETDEAFQRSWRRASASYADARIRAIAAIAPALGPAIDPESLSDIGVPTRLSNAFETRASPFSPGSHTTRSSRRAPCEDAGSSRCAKNREASRGGMSIARWRRLWSNSSKRLWDEKISRRAERCLEPKARF